MSVLSAGSGKAALSDLHVQNKRHQIAWDLGCSPSMRVSGSEERSASAALAGGMWMGTGPTNWPPRPRLRGVAGLPPSGREMGSRGALRRECMAVTG